ncbi:autophagy-related protein 2 [Naviculisporaceae sp. PSN 640]
MASFFQSFRSSLMPKQLLRYALSRLDILDTQALDLDNLDFALGRNTVLEFRDVGLVLQKLERLLELPPSISIQKAKVLLLRVTIPMDFYNSPITAEIDGVDVRLRVASKEEQEKRLAKKRRKSKGTGDVELPTPAEVAQSFLETQPYSEKKELEEALAAESQDLGASVALSEAGSEAGSDDDSTIGTGQALSLPAFLADFLQGIVDRMQIRIRSLTFQVDVQVPVDPNAPGPELVTFQLALDSISVEGVTTTEQDEDGSLRIVPKEGKRHILLNNIRAFLISEANVFSSLARSPSVTSSVASQSSVASGAPRFSSEDRLEQSVGLDSMRSSGELAQSNYALHDSEDAFNIPYDDYDDEEGGEFGEPASSLSTPRASVYQDFTPPTLKEHAKSAIVDPEQGPWATYDRDSRSEPFLPERDSLTSGHLAVPTSSIHSGSGSGSDSGSGGSGVEDLTQSRLYTHEEAESMYMSAFSHADLDKMHSSMPGSWDADEPTTVNSSSPPRTIETSPPTSYASGIGKEEEKNAKDVQTSSSDAESTAERPQTPEGQAPSVEVRNNEYFPERGPTLPQDDIPTPRGPTRLVKEILSLESISVYIPTQHRHVHVSTSDMSKSVSPNVPGAFSVHSVAPTSPRSSPVFTVPEPEPVEKPLDKSVEIVLKPLEVRFDASIGFLLAMVVQRLLEATQGLGGEAVEASSNAESKTPEIKITLEEVAVHFLDKLAGVADTPERIFEARAAGFGSDILLKANISDLRASLHKTSTQTEASVSIEKFKFGYANDDIISFDRQVELFESVASTFPLAGQDISVKATTSPSGSRIEINTLPLHVKLDLQRLDETFGWFGGLSSFLNMGSSFSSNASKAGKGPIKPSSPQKPRGVRFEAPINPNDQTAIKGQNKTDLRINGLRIDVVGRECSAVLNTSALKLIHREEGIGIHFSRIRLVGPYLRNSAAEAPVFVEVADTRLEYITLPRNKDLERLLELITPSKVKFDENDDEIMVDTLLRQRRKGPVLCLTVGRVRAEACRLQQLNCLPGLVEDLAKLGTVAKYLPEDDRPGLLTLGQIKNVDCTVDVGGRFGAIHASLKDLELAQITIPSLIATAVGSISVTRNKIEELVATPETPSAVSSVQKPPVLMVRMIDDMEPVLKIKLMGLAVEYRVPAIMDILGLGEDTTPQDFEASLAASVANLGDQAHTAIQGVAMARPISSVEQSKASKPIKIDISLRDCLVGLNPLGLTSKLTVVLTDAHLDVLPGKDNTLNAVGTLKRASILLIDDTSILESDGAPFSPSRHTQVAASAQAGQLCAKGYVNICQISSAKAVVDIFRNADGDAQMEVEIRDDLLVLETCADSTQTLIALANALTPPTPPSKEVKYRTSVVPVDDLLASITADAFGKAEGDYDFDTDFELARQVEDAGSESDYYGEGARDGDSPLQVDSQYHQEVVHEELFDALSDSLMSKGPTVEDTSDGVLLSIGRLSDDLSIEDNYFPKSPRVKGTAHKWNSKKNTYDRSNDVKVQQSPLKLRVRDVHVIWHLFDGYDWVRTREVISKAVKDVEAKAYERRARIDRRGGFEQDFEEEETVIGDFLFNSIYIGIPANRDPAELARAINQELQDNFTETESIATTAMTAATARPGSQHRPRSKNLKLNRSKRHKITFELRGVNVDLVTFPPDSGETLNSIDIRIHDLDIFDHIPTSTWKKFAMYDHDAGERELGANMVHLELLNTKPVAAMPASEIVLKVTVLPLRLHVDQDALDFITRFFEFKDDTMPIHASPSDIPFIQRAEVNDVPVKLDFKPKRVDYAGLRSGHTTEFMNFLILEDARLVLRHVILYGVSGFDKLGDQLNSIWTDNVKKTQLPGVLAGIGPVRSLVTAGSGIKDLIEIPINEYRKDGRVIRGIGKGAAAFAKNTGTEVVKLGAKLAIGTQYALQGAEGLFAPGKSSGGGGSSSSPRSGAAGSADEWTEDDSEYVTGEEKKQISLYADQPLGIIQGMRGAYASLARDLSVARDAIIAVPAEVMESSSAQGAAKAVLKRAPTIIFRPAIGATKAIGQTLLGATNSLDPHHRRRVEAKYKKY